MRLRGESPGFGASEAPVVGGKPSRRVALISVNAKFGHAVERAEKSTRDR